MTAHVYGTLTVHDDSDWVADVVRRLTDRHEVARPSAWSVDDAPEKFFRRQLQAIVGV
ncbi:Putative FMN-binding domain protein [Amycolatopsis sp. YIM 10]|nr:Putative FMN-binding domain protein [Amycolatopsis sp. YIM 10]